MRPALTSARSGRLERLGAIDVLHRLEEDSTGLSHRPPEMRP